MIPEAWVPNLMQGSYLLASGLFIFSLRWLSRPETARRGVLAGVLGMTLAVLGTFLHPHVEHFEWIAVAVVVGATVWIERPDIADRVGRIARCSCSWSHPRPSSTNSTTLFAPCLIMKFASVGPWT